MAISSLKPKIIVYISAIVVIGVFTLVGYEWWGNRAKIERTFWEICLTDTQDDVLFKKGKPTETNNGRWHYAQEPQVDSSYGVFFKDKKIKFIAFGALQPNSLVSIQGIHVGDSSEAVERQFGKCSQVVSSADKLRRLYLYQKYNVFFALEQNKVQTLGIFNPDLGAPKLTEGEEGT